MNILDKKKEYFKNFISRIKNKNLKKYTNYLGGYNFLTYIKLL